MVIILSVFRHILLVSTNFPLFCNNIYLNLWYPNVLVYLKNSIYNNTLFLCCLNLLFKDIWHVWLSGQNMTVLKSSISNSYDFLHILRCLWQKLHTMVDRVSRLRKFYDTQLFTCL